ncbi:RNA-binding S4 domain protein [Raphanus sativus]|nr:RNA-binding S4 domain protein [Raphanus sativus]
MSRCRSNVGDVRASPQRSWRPSYCWKSNTSLKWYWPARRATSRREVLHTDFVTHPVVKKSVSVLGKLADVAGRLPLVSEGILGFKLVPMATSLERFFSSINIVSFGYLTLMVLKEEKGAQVLIVPDLVDFTALGNVKPFLLGPLLALEYESPRTNTFKTIEASLRIDAVPSAGFKVSRLKLVDLISSVNVRVNWTTVTKNGTTVKTGDVVSVCGKERLKIGEINETKGNLQLRSSICTAVFFGEKIPIPESVAIGGQSDGKSSFLEALLRLRFNVREAKKGEPETTRDENLSMIKSLASPPHRILLFLQQSSVVWSGALLCGWSGCSS